MIKESDLLRAARVFSFDTGPFQDNAIIGNMCGVPVYVGEVRRLNEAIEKEDAKLAMMRQLEEKVWNIDDVAEDGAEIGVIRFFRLNPYGFESPRQIHI
jgi:hypothetical protein